MRGAVQQAACECVRRCSFVTPRATVQTGNAVRITVLICQDVGCSPLDGFAV